MFYIIPAASVLCYQEFTPTRFCDSVSPIGGQKMEAGDHQSEAYKWNACNAEPLAIRFFQGVSGAKTCVLYVLHACASRGKNKHDE